MPVNPPASDAEASRPTAEAARPAPSRYTAAQEALHALAGVGPDGSRPHPSGADPASLRLRHDLLTAEHADLAEGIIDVAADATSRYLRLWAGEHMPHPQAAAAAVEAAQAAYHRQRAVRGTGPLGAADPAAASGEEEVKLLTECTAIEQQIADLLAHHRQVAEDAMSRMHTSGGRYGGFVDYVSAIAAAVRDAQAAARQIP